MSRAINKLKQATHRIAEGDFDHDPQIPTGDEIGDLAKDFTDMAARLKVLEQLSLDASPLTRLPGNIAIERILARRVNAGESFAVCYADLDNFKAYNDRYGYIKGNDVIRCTGEIIFDVVKQHGDDDAFVGHVGGDDFVMIVAPDRIPQVCNGVIDGFREMITAHYSPEDLEKGTTDGIDRYGVQRIISDRDDLHRRATLSERRIRFGDRDRQGGRGDQGLRQEFAGKQLPGEPAQDEPMKHVDRLLAADDSGGRLRIVAEAGRMPVQPAAGAEDWLRPCSCCATGDTREATSLLAAICAEPGVPGVTDEALFRLALLRLGSARRRRRSRIPPARPWNVCKRSIRPAPGAGRPRLSSSC